MAIKTPLTPNKPTKTPTLPDWRQHPKVRELRGQLAALQAEREGRQLAVTNAQTALQAANERLDELDMQQLLGKATADEVALARQAVQAARTRLAQAQEDAEEGEKQAARLRAALNLITPELQAETRAALTAAYKEAVKVLRDALAQAVTANMEAERVFVAAAEQFSGPPWQAGESHLPYAARLPRLAFDIDNLRPNYHSLLGDYIETPYGFWLKGVEQFLKEN